jgi:sulfotransferase family protein
MKIFLFGLRRSGTTLAFNIFRRCQDVRCYYEPLHPDLLAEVDADTKGAYAEYRALGEDLRKRHEGFGAPAHDVAEELFPGNLSERHLAFLDFLFGSADNVVLQPVRLCYQLHQLRARFADARFVWVLRRPEGFVNSVLEYRPSLLRYTDAGIPGSHAIKTLKKSRLVRVTRGWHAFDDPWSQIGAANLIVTSRPCFRGLVSSPTWIKLVALWYDHYRFVSAFIEEHPASCRVLCYEKACGSADYIRALMASLGLAHAADAFDGLIDADVMRKQHGSRIDILDAERMIQERIQTDGGELDLSYRRAMDV